MYIVGGFNAYPAEIERILVEHPDVGAVAVIGVPTTASARSARPSSSPRTGGSLDGTELITWARERMANYKAPRFVWAVEEMPLTASNKIHKPTLRDRAIELLAGAG